jgi:hypothetical protein
MIVIKCLIGLLLFALTIGILYCLGKLGIRFSQEYDEDDNPDYIEILVHGLLVIIVLALCFICLILAFSIGNDVINYFLNKIVWKNTL